MARWFWLLVLMSPALATELQLEANWALDKQWSANAPAQQWVTRTDWTPELDADLALQHRGFELAVQVTPEQAQIRQLYQDVSSDNAEWTVGLKSQEWAYSHGSEDLNWLQDATFVMREQYGSRLTLQTFCQSMPDNDPGCGARITGWYDRFDGQLLTRYLDGWDVAGALQAQLGDGGLVYLEAQMETHGQWHQIQSTSPEAPLRVSQVQGNRLAGTLGVQWTLPTEVTVSYEYHYSDRHFSQGQWHSVGQQLTETSAGLLSDVLQKPFQANQHLYRLNWPILDSELEQILVVWPEMSTWISHTSITTPLTPSLSLSAEVERPNPDGLLAAIGTGPSVRVRLSLRDGITLGD
ncbi:hypothetical protein [Reinekea blandensis]|uniref:Uncharacterized protein n=1 Tax=Reinekea blandensis MED297 TaxID=314283 RepID=A4BK10_9GAMM|nr:hypothetical protein [Reinekea blandensis]EAR07543.1 hypothetical protein MED297_04724 [Reinekea sp. MED297] [Reinekea blandensis MED297]